MASSVFYRACFQFCYGFLQIMYCNFFTLHCNIKRHRIALRIRYWIDFFMFCANKQMQGKSAFSQRSRRDLYVGSCRNVTEKAETEYTKFLCSHNRNIPKYLQGVIHKILDRTRVNGREHLFSINHIKSIDFSFSMCYH